MTPKNDGCCNYEVEQKDNSALHFSFFWIIDVQQHWHPLPPTSSYAFPFLHHGYWNYDKELTSTQMHGFFFLSFKIREKEQVQVCLSLYLIHRPADTTMANIPVNPEFCAFIFIVLVWKAMNRRNKLHILGTGINKIPRWKFI